MFSFHSLRYVIFQQFLTVFLFLRVTHLIEHVFAYILCFYYEVLQHIVETEWEKSYEIREEVSFDFNHLLLTYYGKIFLVYKSVVSEKTIHKLMNGKISCCAVSDSDI